MFQRVLLAVDLNDEASWRKALPAALDVCRQSGGSLHVVTVAPEVSPQIAGFFPPQAGRQVLEKTAADLRRFVAEQVPSDVRVQQIVAQGAIHHEIIAASDQVEADLIVMSAPAPGLRTYLLGATAAHVVRTSPRSVLIVRG
jgi:nucleotide-binding universal stress UspA family protein